MKNMDFKYFCYFLYLRRYVVKLIIEKKFLWFPLKKRLLLFEGNEVLIVLFKATETKNTLKRKFPVPLVKLISILAHFTFNTCLPWFLLKILN